MENRINTVLFLCRLGVLNNMENETNMIDPAIRRTSDLVQGYAGYIQALVISLKECYEQGNYSKYPMAHAKFVSMADHILGLIRSRCGNLIFAAQDILQMSWTMFPWQN